MNKVSMVIGTVTILCYLLLGCAKKNDDYPQWAINNQGQIVCGKKGIEGIDIGTELKSISAEGEYVVVIDGFFDPANPYMQDVVVNIDSVSAYIESHKNPNMVLGEHPYYVTGIIAGDSDNRYQTVLQDVRIFYIPIDVQNLDVEYVLSQLTLAESLGIQVVNCSFVLNEFNQRLLDYIQNSKMLYVCAIGNDGRNEIRFPAAISCNNVVSVVGCDNGGLCSIYSNYSEEADIAAPGESILCRTHNVGKYEFASGSSLATAYVSSVCLYIAMNTEGDASQIKCQLLENSKSIYSLKGKVNGGRFLRLPE